MTELPKLKAIPANPRKPCAGCHYESDDDCIGNCSPIERTDQKNIIWVLEKDE